MASYKNRTETQFIVVHCSATPPSLYVDAAVIDRWHRAKGWNGCGYNRVIKRDGTIEQGRPDDAIGAHVENFNSVSIGICMAGGVDAAGKPENNFTPDQMIALLDLVNDLVDKYPKATVQGHRDFPKVAKACPSFDVKKWWAEVCP
jgi:N-acetylmuramoyl-L-alanine amidase